MLVSWWKSTPISIDMSSVPQRENREMARGNPGRAAGQEKNSRQEGVSCLRVRSGEKPALDVVEGHEHDQGQDDGQTDGVSDTDHFDRSRASP